MIPAAPDSIPNAAAFEVDATAHQEPILTTAHLAGVDPQAKRVEVVPQAKRAIREAELGFKCSSGRLIDYSSKLTEQQKLELSDFLDAYGHRNPNFSINLTDLTDDHGIPLEPIKGRNFQQDMAFLRKIAEEATGCDKICWKIYPDGYRAPVSQEAALSVGRSERLRQLHFDNETDIKKCLKSQKVPKKAKDNATTEELSKLKADAQKTCMFSYARYRSGLAMMSSMRNALEAQMEELENSREPDAHARHDKLRKLLARMPNNEVPKTEKSQKERQENGELAQRWAILFSLTHLGLSHTPWTEKNDQNYRVDLNEIKDLETAAKEAIEALDKPTKDCDGFLSSLRPNRFKSIEEDNLETEKDFKNSVALLGLENRREMERSRVHLQACEKSDGEAPFFVHLANHVAMDTTDQGIRDYMAKSTDIQVALDCLDPKEVARTRELMTMEACDWRASISKANEEFAKCANFADLSEQEIIDLYKQGLRVPQVKKT